MIFRIIKKEDLARLHELLAVNIVVGPVLKGYDREGRPLHDFDRVYDFAELALDYRLTVHSAKRFVLPYRETLANFKVEGAGWQKEVPSGSDTPLVLFGLHPCDINALNKLDLVLARSVYPNPVYVEKRKKLFIIGLDCAPAPQCFCRSMGADIALHGFDLFLTDLGNRYFVEVLSAAAYGLLDQIAGREPSGKEHRLYKQITTEKRKRFTTSVDTTDLTKILDLEFGSPAWAHWGDRCLSCGTCANVCPTCTTATSLISPRWRAATISGPRAPPASSTATTTNTAVSWRPSRNPSAWAAAAAALPVLPTSPRRK